MVISLRCSELQDLKKMISNQIKIITNYLQDQTSFIDSNWNEEQVRHYLDVDLSELTNDFTELVALLPDLQYKALSDNVTYTQSLNNDKRMANILIYKDKRKEREYVSYRRKEVTYFILELRIKTERGIHIHNETKQLAWSDRVSKSDYIDSLKNTATSSYSVLPDNITIIDYTTTAKAIS